MIHQKDWLMRQIEAMVSFLGHILFPEKEETALIQTEAATQGEIEKKAELYYLLHAGKICEAEDWLYENMDDSDIMWLRLAVYFYSEANNCSDAFLEEHNFPRDEILSGLTEVCRRFGYDGLLDL